MPTFRTGEVVEILQELPGLTRVRVRFDDPATPGDRAWCHTALLGPLAVGDQVVCNTTAVELGLGTGGWHVVHWNLSRRELSLPGPDHVMKLRYTSLQADVGTSELAHPDCPTDLHGRVVVACGVHSQVGVVCAVLKALRPGRRVAYVMTDGAAIPLALSDLVRSLRDRDLLDVTVTAGHALGGDLEAVTVPSALTLAAHVGGAEVIVVGMGPGVVGTGTPLGTTSIEVAGVLDATAALGGEPVLCVRASSGDPRERHRGVSHHAATAARLCSARPWVAPVPAEAADLVGVRVRAVEVPDVAEVLGGLGLRITTMGRDLDADRLFFDAAAAAAAVAAELGDRAGEAGGPG